MESKTLKIRANTDNNVKFLFDSPLEGTNAYGVYHLYKFDIEGEEHSLFATDNLHEKLKDYNKGDVVNIRKEEYEAGKMGWIVNPAEGVIAKPSSSTPSAQYSSSNSIDDRTKDIHRQVCLKLAVQSMGTSETLDFAMVKLRMEGLINILDSEDNLL